MHKIVVVGAGPAGMMAAIRASELKADVALVEKNSIPGRKLLLSGKGRCNITNACDLEAFLARFSNGQFLRDAFKKFFNDDLIRFFGERGLVLKVERQGRVFPESDSSNSVLDVLRKELLKNDVKIIYNVSAKNIIAEDKKLKGVSLNDGKTISADKIILATGGISYAFTGSTGDGLEIAKKLGHNITPLRAGLVPLMTKEDSPGRLEGLALKNIRLAFSDGRKKIVSDIGEMMFTDSGISGPLVLSLSGKIIDWLREDKSVYVDIDLKPALSHEQLDARMLREFRDNSTKDLKNVLKNLLPERMVSLFIDMANIAPDKKANQATQKERKNIIGLLKGLRLTISGPLPVEEAMVTRGGVALSEINPRTMESRIVKGLYFAGEIIDIDADTGGFNLQAAFSTGYLAGESAASS